MQKRLRVVVGLLTVTAIFGIVLSAGAEGNPPSVECDSPEWNGEFWKIQINNGVPGEIEANVGDNAIDFALAELTVTWTNDHTNPVFRIVEKGGQYDETNSGLWLPGEGGTFDVEQSISHVTFCFTDLPETTTTTTLPEETTTTLPEETTTTTEEPTTTTTVPEETTTTVIEETTTTTTDETTTTVGEETTTTVTPTTTTTDPADPDAPEELPFTGAGSLAGLILAASALLGGGITLVRRSREVE